MAKLITMVFLGMVLAACGSKKSGDGDGSSGASGVAEVKITEGPNITSSNVASYTVSGTCSINFQPVTIEIGNAKPTEQTFCQENKWTQTYNLTKYALGQAVTITAAHKAANDSTSDQASKPITNSFICGTGYIAVAPLEGYTDKAFCVMKYEAKDVSGFPASQASGPPWASINQADATTKCQSVGSSGFDLITNDEWQTIARSIENVASNWYTGSVGSTSGINRGHSDNNPNSALAASTDDKDGCVNTGQTCGSWNTQKRTHTLGNGWVIWDFAGNVAELVKDKYDSTANLGADAFITQVTDTTHANDITLTGGTASRTRKAKGHFGPSGDHTILNTANYGGLGKLIEAAPPLAASALADEIFIRGGSHTSGSVTAGIFATTHNLTTTASGSTIGFRCVYHP